MKKKYLSESLEVLYDTMTGLHRLGLIDTKTVCDFDVFFSDKSRKASVKGNHDRNKKFRNS